MVPSNNLIHTQAETIGFMLIKTLRSGALEGF